MLNVNIYTFYKCQENLDMNQEKLFIAAFLLRNENEMESILINSKMNEQTLDGAIAKLKFMNFSSFHAEINFNVRHY